MTLKRFIAGAALAGGLGAAALGLGAPMASAQPPFPGPGGPGPGHGWVQQPGYYGAVRDHRPFEYQGQWVNPVFDAGHQGWGFWLGPVWIPLL
jgi:hypothetical protein